MCSRRERQINIHSLDLDNVNCPLLNKGKQLKNTKISQCFIKFWSRKFSVEHTPWKQLHNLLVSTTGTASICMKSSQDHPA